MHDEIKDVEKLMFIEKELRNYEALLSKAADSILEENISKYPIIVAHKQKIALGVPLIDRLKSETNWSVNASTLEEFYSKKLIVESKIDEFRKTYKDPKTHLCLFVLSDIGAQFLFIPRKL
ncbi:MAG: hypothetical protein HKO66_15260 [Saprospiraceae bacterium]|nr:hypothetical protein [Bacteroidia bacterium]NNE15960.1 hypothetical protein [Saprospiraceae bacterium]NNL93599.1 hypothetical protein [Saprospiraceae bacterium]